MAVAESGAAEGVLLPGVSLPGLAGREGGVSDGRTLGPWFVTEVLASFACTLLTAGSYDFADKVLGVSPRPAGALRAFLGDSCTSSSRWRRGNSATAGVHGRPSW